MAENVTADHTIRFNGSVPFSVNDDGRSVAGIKNLIMMLDPATIQRTAASYLAAADRLTSMNEALVSGATAMAKVWEGPSSVESQQSLRTLHATIRELAAKFKAVGLPLEALGRRLLEHKEFVENKSEAWSDNDHTWDDSIPGWYHTMNSSGYEWGSSDELAGQHLRLLNNDLRKVYEEWPFNVHKVVPDLKPPTIPGPPVDTTEDPGDHHVDTSSFTPPGGDLEGPGPDGIDETSAGDTAVPGLPGDTLSGDGGYPGSGTDWDGSGTDGRYPDRTGLDAGDSGGKGPNGADRSGANTNGAGPDAGAGTPDTGGLPNTRGTNTTLEDFQRPAGWAPDPSTSFPNGPTPYPSTGNGPGVGVGGNVLTGPGGLPLNARSASATGGGMPFMPMAGAGANESEDKENSTWLHEDDDVWGDDTDGAVSGRIG
ncbi:hypothetical protein [Nonomuraea sp. NPDC003754]